MMDAAAFATESGVSRETRERLEIYATLLRKWQARINLVAPSTLDDVWRRHMLDSAQLVPLMPEGPDPVFDLGSGGGFPGLVLAILGVTDVTLVEADSRKATFLREVARATETPVAVESCRIEAVPPRTARAVTARALAPLPRLLGQAVRFCDAQTVCLFPKGQDVERELTDATKDWMMQVDRVPSRSDPAGTILVIKELHRA